MQITIASKPFDPWQLLGEYRPAALAGKYGATAVFVGSMRDFNEGDEVLCMELEHYPGMTENFLSALAQEAMQRWDIHDVLIVHRVGEIRPDESIVLLAVWSAHRGAAYEANRYLMETLKSRAPFWKKETLGDQTMRWVEKNTPG